MMKKFSRHLETLTVLMLLILGFGGGQAHATQADPSDPTFDGLLDTALDIGDYRQVLGGKFPAGNAINGDDASGGTFRALDDPGNFFASAFTSGWGKDDFFSNQQGVAATLRFNGAAVWDNNGLEDGSHATINKVCLGGANFRDPCTADGDCPGSTCSSASFYEEAFGELVQPNCCTSPRSDNGQIGMGRNHALSLSNSVFDFLYATRIEFDSAVTIDELIGYFAPTPLSAFAFDPDSPLAIYRMNIWSAGSCEGGSEAGTQCNVDGDCDGGGTCTGDLMPTNTGSFAGDVLSTDTTAGTFTRSDTGVRRDFHSTTTTIIDDPVLRLTWIPDSPITLDAGVYYYNHDVRVRVGTCTAMSQGFWRRVCKKDHPDQPDRSFLSGAKCDDMNPDPHSDPCERARSQFQAVRFNVESDRLQEGCFDDDSNRYVNASILAIDALIDEGTNASCKEASALAAAINEGSASTP